MDGSGKKSPGLAGILRECRERGPLAYRDFIELALYHPTHGYYRRDAERVGRKPGRDFYTAPSLGPVFARLVTSAALELLGPDDAARACFVEIGAEPGRDLLGALPEQPFAATRAIRPGDPLELDGFCVVFANEWLDALPFHRLVFRRGAWRERGVRAAPEGGLEETLLDALSPPIQEAASRLPETAAEGYELDLPLDAERALARLAGLDWTGLLLLFDYGKSWETLAANTPGGTARAFYRHQRESDLLRRPGEQDITCDLCWDPLRAILEAAGLRSVTLQSQEAFFVHHASAAAEAIVRDSAGDFSRERQTLMELLHPSHMGQRFQVLHALR